MGAALATAISQTVKRSFVSLDLLSKNPFVSDGGGSAFAVDLEIGRRLDVRYDGRDDGGGAYLVFPFGDAKKI